MEITYTGIDKTRLDKHLQSQFPDLSRARIQKHILAAPVMVNGKPATVHHWLKSGDIVTVPDVPQNIVPKTSAGVSAPSVLFQSDEYIIIVKPAGLLVHPTDQHETGTLTDWLLATYPAIQDVGDAPERPGIVHRLDRDVSGLMIIALAQRPFDYFKQQFQSHTIDKRYRCLVHGLIVQDEISIDTPIDRHPTQGRMVAQSGKIGGKPAVTHVKVLERFLHHSLLDVAIVTGRTHQIRTHLSSIGHAIVGDRLYRTKDLKTKKATELLDRPFLIAYHLSFVDPDGTPRTFDIPLPDDMEAILSRLRAHEKQPVTHSNSHA